jgi:hypothetical protein
MKKFQRSEKRQCVVTNIIVQMIEGCKNISLSTLSRAPVHKDPGQLHIFKGKYKRKKIHNIQITIL